MVFAHVINKKTGVERKNVTLKSYQAFPKIYDLVGYVDENGESVEAPSQPERKSVQKKSEAVVVSRHKMSPEELELKKAELRAMNEASIKRALDEQAKNAPMTGPEHNLVFSPEVKERKKPGPKPKIKQNEA